MTRRDELERVLDGIEAAKDAGFDPVKINAVIERGVNDDEIVALATYGRERQVEVEVVAVDAIQPVRRERDVESARAVFALLEMVCGDACRRICFFAKVCFTMVCFSECGRGDGWKCKVFIFKGRGSLKCI
jgi:MoaA/NifB/PqqE/SkfB family radical SAM enzyme